MRKIFVSEPQEEGYSTEKQLEEHAKSPSNITTSSASGTVILTASEMQKFFRNWEDLGKGDFSVDPNLADSIKAYLTEQEKLAPLREKLAEMIYKPFVVESSYVDTTFNLVFEPHIKARIKFLNTSAGAPYQLITLSDFKALLLAAGIPYATFIPSKFHTYIDFYSYCMANGWNIEVDKSTVRITLSE